MSADEIYRARPVRLHSPLTTAAWKQQVDHFRVDELLDLPPEGGEHHYLHLQKTALTSADVAATLARFAGVPVRDVGFCGLKDRQAVCSQWFSLALGRPDDLDWSQFQSPGIEVLEARRGRSKLRRGQHSGNRFKIIVDCDSTDGAGPLQSRIDERLESLRAGFPNAFGHQRFGRRGENVAQAQQWLQSGRRLRNRQTRSLLLSAIRSAFFNELLEQRVEDQTWKLLLSGDRGMPPALAHPAAGLQGAFSVCRVPAGSLPGDDRVGTGKRGRYEQELMPRYGTLLKKLRSLDMRTQWRPMVAAPQNLSWEWQSPSRLTLSFDLGVGCYASVMLEQIFDLVEAPVNAARSSPVTETEGSHLETAPIQR